MNTVKNIKVIISGGGTGGHIFPAIAIANAIKKTHPNAEILFIGALGKMEMEKVPQAGYPIEGLHIRGLRRSLSLENLKFPFLLIKSLRKASRIIRQFKPDVVVGVGGFASGPTLWSANRKKIPSLIQEQNSYPGITNKLLAKKVNSICVAYDGMEKFFPENKIIKTGNPIREEVTKIEGKRAKAMQYFGLDPDKKTILIIGGSLGALAINETMVEVLQQNQIGNYQIIWQTGKYFYKKAVAALEENPHQEVKSVEFISKMDLAYAAADVIISRAGAIAIAEISTIGKAAIFVPLPTAAEDHQTKNAKALVDQHAAIMVPNNQTGQSLFKQAVGILKDDIKRENLARNIKKFGSEQAAQKIALEVIKIIKQ